MSAKENIFDLDKIMSQKLGDTKSHATINITYGGSNDTMYDAPELLNTAATPLKQQVINRRSASTKSAKGDILVGSDDYNRVIADYEEFPKANFMSIPPKSFVRYISNGVLKKGGKVLERVETANGVGLRLMTPYSKNASFWVIYERDFERIFIKKLSMQQPKLYETKASQPATQQSMIYSTQHAQLQQQQPLYQQPMIQPIEMQPQSILSQLGDKLLFEDAESLGKRLDVVEKKLQTQEQLIQRLIKMIDVLNKKISN